MSHAFLPHVGSSRVENIKKRFEANTTSSYGSEGVSPRVSPERFVSPAKPSDGVVRPAAKKTVSAARSTISSLSEFPNRVNGKSRQTSPARFPVKYDRQSSGSSSRGNNVKRSPAFRCDKMVRGRNVVGNSRLSGERPKLNEEKCSHLLNNSDRLSARSVSNHRPTPRDKRVEPKPDSTDELSTVFSQRGLRTNIKSNVTNPSLKPVVLQKPQIDLALSPNVGRLPNSKLANNSPNNSQPTKPNSSTNAPRPVEYAVVNKTGKLSEGRLGPRPSTTTMCVNNKPLVMLRHNVDRSFHSKSLIAATEESPVIANPRTKDLPTKSAHFIVAQNSEPSFAIMTPTVKRPGDAAGISHRLEAAADPPLPNNVQEGAEKFSQDICRLQLTNTLKKALSSPLPVGPPPKKPPRTFLHPSATPPVPSEERNVNIQSVNDTRPQPTPVNPIVVAYKNDLQNRPKSNVNITKEQLKRTNMRLYGKTRSNSDNPARSVVSKNNTPNNSFMNLHAPNDMRSIRNVFPVTKSTENLSVPFNVNQNVLGPKRVNLELISPEVRDKTVVRPLRSKTESEIMLRKLENVLQSRQNSGVILRPKSPISPRRMVDKATGPHSQNFEQSQTLGYSPARPLPQVPKNQRNVPSQIPTMSTGTGTLFGSCLESMICVGIDPVYARTSNFYEKLNAKKSEFFVTGYTDLVSNQTPELMESRNSLYGHMRKSSSVEHIYAEPFEFLRKNGGAKSTHSLEAQPRFSGNKVPVLAVTADKIVEIGHYRDTTIPTQNINVMLPVRETTDPNLAERNRSDALHYLCTPITPDSPAPNAADGGPMLPGGGADPRESEMGGPALLRLADLVNGDQALTTTTQPLNQNKIHHLLNQAFNLAALPLDNSDSDPPSSPEEPISLSPTFENVGVQPAADGDVEPEKGVSQLTERRKRYLTRCSSVVASRKPRDYPHLFQYLLLVALTMDHEKKVCKPYVKWKYPPDVEVTPYIENLCFPDAPDWPRTSFGEQSYSLVITNEHGERTFGCCRRVMPEGMDVCLPLAYCIISPVRATGFYYKVLTELESLHGQPESVLTSFVSELYNTQVPGPGQVLKPLFSSPVNANSNAPGQGLKRNRTIVRRPLDLRLEERDLTQLFSSLCVSTLLQVFGSLLLERKVVLFSKSLGKLSSCVEALQSILYPFSWQHTFIPVLPSSKVELCDAPTPYIFGILKDKEGQFPELCVTDGIVVDLEGNHLAEKVGDESTILPTRLKHSLKVALQLVSATTRHGDSARNVLISEAFIRAFVEVCGHYRQHITTQTDGKKVFEREAFVHAVQEPTVQQFLEWFTMTAMFNAFIETRLEGGSRARDMFEQRVTEHSDEVHKNTVLYLKNSRVINMKLKSLGNRFKDWTLLSKNASPVPNVRT